MAVSGIVTALRDAVVRLVVVRRGGERLLVDALQRDAEVEGEVGFVFVCASIYASMEP